MPGSWRSSSTRSGSLVAARATPSSPEGRPPPRTPVLRTSRTSLRFSGLSSTTRIAGDHQSRPADAGPAGAARPPAQRPHQVVSTDGLDQIVDGAGGRTSLSSRIEAMITGGLGRPIGTQPPPVPPSRRYRADGCRARRRPATPTNQLKALIAVAGATMPARHDHRGRRSSGRATRGRRRSPPPRESGAPAASV